jgi:hypothetical protein
LTRRGATIILSLCARKATKAEFEKLMYDIVTCPECQRRLKLPTGQVGNQVTCPQCAATFVAGLGRAPPEVPEEGIATVVPVTPVPDIPAAPEMH